jgi:hypothetical protein
MEKIIRNISRKICDQKREKYIIYYENDEIYRAFENGENWKLIKVQTLVHCDSVGVTGPGFLFQPERWEFGICFFWEKQQSKEPLSENETEKILSILYESGKRG